jgi:LSD1 subclass zinc finger protein
MFGMDSYWLVSEALLVITFIVYIVTQVLMPSKKEIEGGVTQVPIWVPVALGFMVLGTASVIGFAFLYVEKNLVVMISAGVLLLALLLGFADYILTKRKAEKYVMTEGDLHHALDISNEGIAHHPQQTPQYHDHQLAAPQHEQLPAAGAGMMTVECPQCGNHLQLPEGSHQITCPHCGLSGTM